MKGLKVVATLLDMNDTVAAERLTKALTTRFPFFDFTHEPVQTMVGADFVPARIVKADGPWHVKANLRPSLDQIVKFAEGYLTCLLDARDSALEQTAAVEAVLAKEEP